MPKLIINHGPDLDARIALECVSQVIAGGRVSQHRKMKQYCFVTTFDTLAGKVCVEARNLEYYTAPDSFMVYLEDGRQDFDSYPDRSVE